MELFEFGEGPKAASLGYYLDRTIVGTRRDVCKGFVLEDVILVTGAAINGMPGVFEFAVFEKMHEPTTTEPSSKAPVFDIQSINEEEENLQQLIQHDEDDRLLDEAQHAHSEISEDEPYADNCASDFAVETMED